jgi:hypothetical protein
MAREEGGGRAAMGEAGRLERRELIERRGEEQRADEPPVDRPHGHAVYEPKAFERELQRHGNDAEPQPAD